MYPSPWLFRIVGCHQFTIAGSTLIASDGDRQHLYTYQTKQPDERRYFVCRLSQGIDGQTNPDNGGIEPVETEEAAREFYSALPEKTAAGEQIFGPADRSK